MPQIRLHVDSDGAYEALGKFSEDVSTANRQSLLLTIGLGQLRSIYKTFAEEGSPSGSWPALAASTVKRMHGADGHKLLIQSGRLRNSIRVVANTNRVTVGTNLVYAAVHQFGSRDRGAGLGPQARIAGRDVAVKEHASSWTEKRGKVRTSVIDKNGVSRSVLKLKVGPLKHTDFKVTGHRRFQNIPARPYLVFRPEDPARIQEEVALFYRAQAKNAGLKAR